VVLEATPKPARDIKPVLGYFSWGSIDPQNRVRSSGLGFAPGAIGGSFVSSDLRTLNAPPDTWMPTGNPRDRASIFEGSSESLLGDLIRDGITGAAGHVADPFLQGVVRPQVLFPAYFEGFNLVESFYLAMPYLSWQNVVIGDPLCAPFRPRSKVLSRSAIEGAEDPITELPAFFSRRRVAAVMAQSRGIPEPAAAQYVRGQALLARGEQASARSAFEQAVKLTPQFVAGWLQLATLDEQSERFDRATDAYRRVLAVQPNNVVALNNLAYAMAVRQMKPAEALPFAQRAATLARNDPQIADTLGWIYHLVGNDKMASQVLGPVARLGLNQPDVRLHAAIVFAAVGAPAVAQRELEAALRLNPDLENSEDVRQVRDQLEKLAPAK
jgi:tetratricopeptide (TPR) repeat protein